MSDRELPDGWEESSVGAISAAIQYGYTASALHNSEGPRFLRITDIQDGAVNWDSVPTCEIDKRDFAKFELRIGDIVFARTGATTGKCFLIRECPSAVFASYLIRLRPHGVMTPNFLYLFFQSPVYWTLISENVSGNAQPNCNASKLANLPLPVPPIVEQTRIVEKLESLLARVNASRERLGKVPAILKRFRQAILAAACSGRLTADWREKNSDTEPATKLVERILNERRAKWELEQKSISKAKGRVAKSESWKSRYEAPRGIDLEKAELVSEIPETWRSVSFDTFVVSSLYGPRFSTDVYCDDGFPSIRTTDIKFGGSIRLNNPPKIKISDADYEIVGLKHGDLLVTRTGATIGKCALYDERLGRATPSAYLIRFRLVSECVDRHYILLFLISLVGQQLLTGGTTAVAQPNVNVPTISQFPFPLPPHAEQHEIVRRVEKLFKLADAIEKRVTAGTARAEKLTQAILAKAFRGELVVTEAELARQEGRSYESAAELLRRLKPGEASLFGEAEKPKVVTKVPGAPALVTEKAKKGRVIKLLTLLLRTADSEVTREKFDNVLLLLLNEDVRKCLAGMKVPLSKSLVIPSGMDTILAELKVNKIVDVETRHSLQTISAGPKANALSSFSEELQAAALEAIAVYDKLKRAGKLLFLASVWNDKSVLERAA